MDGGTRHGQRGQPQGLPGPIDRPPGWAWLRRLAVFGSLPETAPACPGGFFLLPNCEVSTTVAQKGTQLKKQNCFRL